MELIQIVTNPSPKIGGPYQAINSSSIRLHRHTRHELWVFGDSNFLDTRLNIKTFSTLRNNKYGFRVRVPRRSDRKKHRSADAVIVHGFFVFPLLLSIIIGAKRLIVMPHGSLEPYDLSKGSSLKKLYISAFKFISKNKIEFWVASNLEKSNLSLCFPDHKVYCVGLGIELVQFKQFSPSARPLDSSDLELIYVGRLAKKKNLHLLLECLAAEELKNARLKVVGGGEKKFQEGLKSLAKKINVDSRVSFLGNINGIERFSFFSNSHIFLLPSRNENFAIAVAESISSLTPVIVSREVASKEVIIRYGCGVVIEEISVEQITRAIFTILDNYEWFVKNCNEARMGLDWDIVIKKWLEILLETK